MLYNDTTIGGTVLKWRNGNPVTRYEVIKMISMIIIGRILLEVIVHLVS